MSTDSTNPAKVIDVQDGDIFRGADILAQIRGDKIRHATWKDHRHEWLNVGTDKGWGVPIDRHAALAALRAMGYTIRELDRHGREVVARNEVTGNYVAKCDGEWFAISNPAGTHRIDVLSGTKIWNENPNPMYGGWRKESALGLLATAPAYTPAPKPEAGKVEWPTHAVVDCSGAFVAIGTSEQCHDYRGCDTYSIVPMPRPPMSAEMRAFVQAVADFPFSHEIVNAATALLNSEVNK